LITLLDSANIFPQKKEEKGEDDQNRLKRAAQITLIKKT